MNDPMQCLDLGTRIGRGQAFGLLAAQSLLSQARCLQEIRDSGAYKALGLTWDEFCPQYAGLSRQRVDQLIHNLEEFGETYFQFSEIVRISPEAYRRIAPKIENHSIDIEGEQIPITPENAPRIRREVQKMRAELQEAQKRSETATRPNIISIQIRFDCCFAEMNRMVDHYPMYVDSAPALDALCTYATNHIAKIKSDLAARRR